MSSVWERKHETRVDRGFAQSANKLPPEGKPVEVVRVGGSRFGRWSGSYTFTRDGMFWVSRKLTVPIRNTDEWRTKETGDEC